MLEECGGLHVRHDRQRVVCTPCQHDLPRLLQTQAHAPWFEVTPWERAQILHQKATPFQQLQENTEIASDEPTLFLRVERGSVDQKREPPDDHVPLKKTVRKFMISVSSNVGEFQLLTKFLERR